jgi:hypothetical protein
MMARLPFHIGLLIKQNDHSKNDIIILHTAFASLFFKIFSEFTFTELNTNLRIVNFSSSLSVEKYHICICCMHIVSHQICVIMHDRSLYKMTSFSLENETTIYFHANAKYQTY